MYYKQGMPIMSNDHFRIMCPSLMCRKVLAVPNSSRGQKVRCKSCGATIRVPEKQAAPAAPAKSPGKQGAETPAAPGKAAA